MAGRREPLDEEQRALHDSWDTVLRTVGRVVLGTVLIWGVCSALRYGVHATSDTLLAFAAGRVLWWAPLVLAAVLLLGGCCAGCSTAGLAGVTWRRTA